MENATKKATKNKTEMKMLNPRQRGITMIEITAGLVIIALLSIFLIPRVGALLGRSKIESAVQEIAGLVGAFEQYRSVTGSYGLISFTTLENGGYHIEPFGAGNTANAYGQLIELSTAAADATTFNLTYDTAGSEPDCKQIETRIVKLSPVASALSSGTPAVPVSGGTPCNSDGEVVFKIGN